MNTTKNGIVDKLLSSKTFFYALGIFGAFFLIFFISGSIRSSASGGIYSVFKDIAPIFSPLLIYIALYIYFLPSVIAFNNKHKSLKGIFILNLLLGVIFIGWVIALIWAFNKSEPSIVVVPNNEPIKKSVEKELSESKELFDKGVISEEEYKQMRNNIINRG